MCTFHFLFLMFFLLANSILCAYYGKLKFNNNKEFTILQFTDLHYGEDFGNDVNSSIIEEKLINYTNPDLIIITGDAVSGDVWNGLNETFYQECWKMWAGPMEKLKVPYAYALGNHDDQGNLNRKKIVELDQTNKYSLTQFNPDFTGATNYFLEIKSSNASHHNEPAALLWLFDTNDVACEGMLNSWGCFEKDQVSWYTQESKRIRKKLGYSPKGMSFFHIPLMEYLDQYNWRKSYGGRYEAISCPRRNTGLFEEFLKNKNMVATFCGHDHNNDNGGLLYGIDLVYGRKTGYGSYGPSDFQRGARVIKLKEKYDEQTGKMSFDYTHHVVQEDGSIVQNSEPVWKGWYDFQERCAK